MTATRIERRRRAAPTRAPRPLLRGKGWLAYLVGGAVFAFAYLLFPRGGTVQVLWYQVLPISSFALILVGIRRNRPVRPLAWYLIAAGQFAWVVGDLIWYVGRTLFHLELGFPNVADIFYLVAYPFLIAGSILYMRAHATRDRGTFVEAAVVTIGVGLVSWVFFMAPVAHAAGMSFPARAVSLGYPLMDILVIGILMSLLLSRSHSSAVSRLLGASFVATLIADTAQLIILLKGSYSIGGLIDPFWALGYVCFGAAALHGSNRQEPHSLNGEAPIRLRSRVALLTTGALLAPAAMLAQQALHRKVDVALFAGAAAGMFALAIHRISGLARALQRLHEERSTLLSRILRAGEEERTLIAADLHDGPIQRLAALRFRLEHPIRRLEHGDPGPAVEELRPLGEDLSAEVTRLRSLMHSLRPPVLDQSGLVDALADLLAEFEREAAVLTRLDATARTTIGDATAIVLYRVAQEALRNVGNHASATRVLVHLTHAAGETVLTIEDDGVGFETSGARDGRRDRFGLVAMRERVETAGGRFLVASVPGEGTTVRASMPEREPVSA